VLLWSFEQYPRQTIKFRCDEENMGCRIRQDLDLDSSATFAVISSMCLESSQYMCHNMWGPLWHGGGGLLATAVCRDRTNSILGSTNVSVIRW
jgi:hypothetical protein